MKHILTCSFGKDSIATALLALQHGEPLDELVYSEVMFSDTVSGELPEHLFRHRNRCCRGAGKTTASRTCRTGRTK